MAAHTNGFSGSMKPHGSTFSPANPLKIRTSCVENIVEWSAASRREKLIVNGPGAMSTSWRKTSNHKIGDIYDK